MQPCKKAAVTTLQSNTWPKEASFLPLRKALALVVPKIPAE